MEEALIRLRKDISIKLEKKCNLDETLDSITSEHHKVDIISTLEKVYNVFYKGKQDILKIVNWYITEFLENKWSGNINTSTTFYDIVKEYVDSSCSRSSYGKYCYFKSILKIVVITIKGSECCDSFVLQPYDKLQDKLEDVMLTIEQLKPNKLLKKYIQSHVSQHFFILLNGLLYYIKHKNKKAVNTLLQFCLSQEQFNSLSCTIYDEYGLFSDIKDEHQKDPQWYIWFVLVLYIKHKCLKSTKDTLLVRGYWDNIDKLVLHYLYISKVFYTPHDRNARTVCLIRLFEYLARCSFTNHNEHIDCVNLAFEVNKIVIDFFNSKGIETDVSDSIPTTKLIKPRKRPPKKKDVKKAIIDENPDTNDCNNESDSNSNIHQQEMRETVNSSRKKDKVKQKTEIKDINMDYLMFCTKKTDKDF